ncbi:MAG TPA: vWA domain-containing protein [Polyangiales bacterium]|nr:vWA domain-containing protein [Polyangiales bacterium]
MKALPLFMVVTLLGCSAGGTREDQASPPPANTPAMTAGTPGAPRVPQAGAAADRGGFDNPTELRDAGAAMGGNTPRVDAAPDPDKCGEHHFDLERKPAQLLLVLDRSASMEDAPDGASDSTPKWDLVVPAVNQVIQATDTTISWGLKVFPEGEGDECIATSVTNHIDVELAAMNAAKVTGAVMATTPKGNGTPTGDAVLQGLKYLQSLTDKNPKYILLATDGEPSCPKPSDSARPHAVQSIAMAASAGIHTFVLGVATTKKSATSVLNDMAVAGMEPRADDPNPLASRYYLANTKDQLASALQQITGQISGCTFNWDDPPPVPENIAVKVGGVKAPRDPKDGWDYSSGDHKSIEVRGSWCDKIKTSAKNVVEIIFGCPDVEIL